MMLNVTVERKPADNPEQAVIAIRDRVRGGLGPDAAGPALSHEIAAIERETFETEGHGTWPPLAPATVMERQRAGYPGAHPILVRSGRLKESLADPQGRGSADALVRMAPKFLEQGTLVPYAIYHMHTAPNRPARPPIMLRTVDIMRLRQTYEEFILQGDGE